VEKESRIFIAGHRGLVGSAIARALDARGHANVLKRTHAELDLTDPRAVAKFFDEERPEYVFLAAGKVGGIAANDAYPAEFIHQNLAIQVNVIHEAWKHGVERLVFLGSSCIYPRDCPQPIREEYLLTGPLEPTNQAYALAKIAGIEMCASYNRQYGTRFVCAMPTNLYGIGDKYDLATSHVLPSLIRKAHEAKERGASCMPVWGTGRPRRELMFADDLAQACLLLASTEWSKVIGAAPDARLPLLNVGTGSDLSIAELAALACKVVGFSGDLAWDSNKPDGTPQKLLDVSRMRSLGWRAATPLEKGIAAAYADFLARHEKSGSSASAR
jgi:GDP-L-fucose synthase